MASREKNSRLVTVANEAIHPLDATYVSKLADLYSKNSHDTELTKAIQSDKIPKHHEISQHVHSLLENNMATRKNSFSKKGSETLPVNFKGPKKPTKLYQAGDTHVTSNDWVPPSSPAVQFSSQNQIKPTMKTLLNQFRVKYHSKAVESSKMLVTVNVSGSPGPIRFLVDIKDPVSRVTELALRAYAREGRLPHLGFNSKLVQLLSGNGEFEALDPVQSVGSIGTRQFLLCKRRTEESNQSSKKAQRVGPMRWKFVWSKMNNIVCSH